MTTRHSQTNQVAMRAFAFFTAFGVLTAVGCSDNLPKTAVVQGTITLNGKPLPNGSVTFFPVNAAAASATIRPDGGYQLTTFREGDGAVLGTHKVVIIALEQVDPEKNPTPEPIVPYKYTSASTTDLRAEVKDEVNTINFDLKADVRKSK